MNLDDALAELEPRHRRALERFADNAGSEAAWPQPLPDGTRLISSPKGIYKSEWSKYALSVRQTLHSKYPDREPVSRADGSWTYLYHQEGEDPEAVEAAEEKGTDLFFGF